MKQALYTIFLAFLICAEFNYTFAMELELQEKNHNNSGDTNCAEYKFYIPKEKNRTKYSKTTYIIKAAVKLTSEGIILQPKMPEFLQKTHPVLPFKEFLECTETIHRLCFDMPLEARALTKENYQLLLKKIKEENTFKSYMADIATVSA